MTEADEPPSSASHTSRRNLIRWLGTASLAAGTGSQLSGAASPTQPPESRGDPPGRKPDDDQEVARSPPPGPDLLYDDPVTAPQLETGGVWEAEPLLVMGSEAYVDGEYLYQAFAYDDYGAETGNPDTPPLSGATTLPTGGVRYPTDQETYGYNAADLLEFRATTVPEGVRYRISLTTMLERDVAAIAIGIDTDGDSDGGRDDWGYDIGELGDLGLDHVLVTWGPGAELDDEPVETDLDFERNQIEITVPLDPGGETWRHYLVTGLWDAEIGAFKQVQETADGDNPGGAMGQDPPPIFDVGFRLHEQEPMDGANAHPETLENELEALREGGLSFGHWRDHEQAQALADEDISSFHADIDFGRIDSGENLFNVPRYGEMNRIFSSHATLGQGIDADRSMILGPIQPYGLYVPSTYQPDDPAPLVLVMHGGSQNHNQYPVSSPNYFRQIGEQRGSLVVSPEARGPGLSYDGPAELDTVEALGDVLSRYAVDRERISASGYSMGGLGTLKMTTRYPDLFVKGFVISGGGTEDPIDPLDINLRHVPILLWAGTNDLATVPSALNAERFREMEYRYQLDYFAGYDHLFFSVRDRWDTACDFLEGDYLGDATATTEPDHVTFRRYPTDDVEKWGLIKDKAYWVVNVETADGRETGLVDAYSRARGTPDPIGADYYDGGTEHDPRVTIGMKWLEGVQSRPPSNTLELDLDGVTAATLYVDEAGIDATEPIELVVESTHEATLRLVSAHGDAEVIVDPDSKTYRVHL